MLASCGRDSAPPAAPPHLAFAATAHDFGRVPQGTAVEHEFPFVNDGGATLSITELRVACDAAAVLVGPGEVPPGGRGAVRARFDTAAAPGAQQRTVTVYSNDPTQRAVLLTLAGSVALDAAAEPAQVYLGTVPPGAELAQSVALRAGNDAVRFLGASSAAPQLAVRLADAADGRALLIGTVAGAAPGPFTAVVRVHTTSPTRPLLEVPVAGIIAAPTP
ncbi:MAG: DUF1573 domain-containing protein [Deltaproteobacteria bacterium]|nr:DUF1573 domain-containing protein [Deltaproteobacteria bacterium]